MTRGIWT
jgi:glycerol uptake facilitator protein